MVFSKIIVFKFNSFLKDFTDGKLIADPIMCVPK